MKPGSSSFQELSVLVHVARVALRVAQPSLPKADRANSDLPL